MERLNTVYPLVTVIVPNYNHARFLKQRIESILNQEFTDFELILLDDCSTDNSREIIEQYRGNPKISRIEYNDLNSGSPFRQWNKGIGFAKGELIWMAESDDSTEPSFLSKTVDKMKEYPSVGIVYVQSREFEELSGKNFLSFDGHDRFSNAFLEPYFENGRTEVREKLAYENTIPNASAVLFRKNIYQKCGGADETMKLCGDWMLWTKMLFESDVYFIAEPLNHFRLTPSSARSRYSQEQTLHERLQVLHFIKAHRISNALKTERRLIQKLFNSYKLTEIATPFKSVMAQKGLIDHPKGIIFKAILLSLLERVRRKLVRGEKWSAS